MQKWEEKIIDWEKGKEEGRNEGKALAVIEILEEFGELPEALRSEILSQYDPALLSLWLKKAAKAQTLSDFIKSANLSI